MAKITASEVNKLRKHTGAGMMDCKKALVEAEGDFDAAVDILRKKGQKVAAKRADRDSAEGAVIASVNEAKTEGVIISLNCETDFVAKNDDFVALAKELALVAVSTSTKEEFMAADFNGTPVSEVLIEKTGVIGEKIEIGTYEKVAGNFVGSYIHAGNKIATLTVLSAPAEGADVVAKDVSMQAAAMNPVALNEEGVDASTIEKEVEIAKDQLRAEGKPEAMLENIAKGKIKRFFKDNTLVNQMFIKDNKKTVAQYVKTIGDITVVDFKRVSL